MGLSAGCEVTNRHQIGRLLAEAASLTGFGAWECDLSTQRLTWTDGVYDLFGLERGSTLYRSATVDLYEPQSRAAMEAKRSAVLAGGGSFTMDAEIRNAAGDVRWMRLSGRALHEHGRPIRLFGSKHDITQEKRAWQELSALAHHDPVTGLANRRAFEARFDELARAARDHGGIAALVLVDLDHFKRINDGFGHEVGDEVLIATADVARRTLRPYDLVARLGGEEFCAILPATTLREAIAIAERLRAGIAAIRLDSLGAHAITASFGVHEADPLREQFRGMLRSADENLYAAKAAGRNLVRSGGATPEPLGQ